MSKKYILSRYVVLLACGLVGFSATAVAATTFPVHLNNPATQESCDFVGSFLQVDPVTGKVDIDLVQDPSCGEITIPASTTPTMIAVGAKLQVTGGTAIGGGTTGAGTVALKLTTGLAVATPGVTCVPDGQSAVGVAVDGDWTSPLCTNCGSTVTRSVLVRNTGSSTGTIVFKAKCSVLDTTHTNLSSVITGIAQTPTVTVAPGTAPAPTFCSSVSQLAANYGLNDSMRQTAGKLVGGIYAGAAIDLTEFNTAFGALTTVAAPGTPDLTAYGFPGKEIQNKVVTVKKDKFISLRFRAPSATTWAGRVGVIDLVQTLNPYTAAIMPCPGQFNSDANYPMVGGCVRDGGEDSFAWKIGTGAGYCELEPGKVYYLNIISARPATPTISLCASAECAQKIASSHNYPSQ